ncbi:MAG: hypothetical protein ACRDND_15110, partial [Streptosporangiaceae bacterium]
YGTWLSYSGAARIELAVVLLAAAGGLAYAGIRWRVPRQATRPGRAGMTFMLLAWALAIVTFLVCVTAYINQERLDYLARAAAAPGDPIAPVSLLGMAAVFLAVLIASPDGFVVRVGSAIIGAIAAWMIFELPFDLIVMARTYPPITPDPALYRALFFLPLFLIEITTLSLLTWSPLVWLRRASFVSFALMLTVFAVWALFGFGFPSAPVPIALNVVSKILAFVTGLTLFLPQRDRAAAPEPQAGAAQALR